MSVNYNKLWKMLIDKELNKTMLKEKAKLSTNVIAKLSKNETVSMETMEKICAALECNIGDIIDYVEEK